MTSFSKKQAGQEERDTYLAGEEAAGKLVRECDEHDSWNGWGISIAAAKVRQALEILDLRNARSEL